MAIRDPFATMPATKGGIDNVVVGVVVAGSIVPGCEKIRWFPNASGTPQITLE